MSLRGALFWFGISLALAIGIAIGSGTSIPAAVTKVFWVTAIGLGIIIVYLIAKNKFSS